MPLVYNAVDHHGGIVGSIETEMGKDFYPGNPMHVPSLFIHPDFRKTSLFHDLAKIPLATGRPVEASIANPKLAKMLRRISKRDTRFSAFQPHWVNPEGAGQNEIDQLLMQAGRTPRHQYSENIDRARINFRNQPDILAALDQLDRLYGGTP